MYVSIGNSGRRRLSDEIQMLQREHLSLASVLTDTSTNLTDLRRSNELLKHKLTDMKNNVHEKSRFMTDLKSQLTESDRQLHEEQDKTVDLQDTIEKLQHKLSVRDTEVSRLKQSNEELEADMLKYQAVANNADNVKNALQNEVAALKLQGKNLDGALKAELAHAHTQFVELKHKLQGRDEAFRALTAENKNQHDNSIDLTGQLKSMKQSLESMKSKYEDRTKRWKDMQKQHEDEEKQLQAAKVQLANEHHTEEKMQQQRDKYLALVNKEKELNGKLTNDLETTRLKAKNWEDEAETIADKLTQMETSISKYFQKAKGLREEITKLGKEHSEVKTSKTNAKNKMDDAVQEAMTKASEIISAADKAAAANRAAMDAHNIGH